MGTISSGIGLISGLDINALVEQLMSIESRPRQLLATRIGKIDAQRTALLDLSARVSGLLSKLTALKTPSAFNARNVSSTAPDVLGVSGGAGAAVGSYNFIVRSLASTQQMVSRGFDSASAALGSGILSFESAAARVNSSTRLDVLNGYAGVARGSFKLTDGQNRTATVNIADAVTLSEVVERINAAGLNIEASVHDDRLELRERSGGAIRIEEVNGGRTAADLGFAPGNTYDGNGALDGRTLMHLSDGTPLSALNDGNGVRRARAGGDFVINGMTVDLSNLLSETTRIERLNHGAGADLGRIRITTYDSEGSQTPVEVDLTGLTTIGEIRTAIEAAVPGVSVTRTGSSLTVSYTDSSTERRLKIEDLTGSAAKDLGINGDSEVGRIRGRDVLKVERVGDVLAAINFADANDGSISASLDGTRIVIDAGGEEVDLSAVAGSGALFDLGLQEETYSGQARGGRVLGSLDSVLLKTLNGGRGFAAGTVQINAGGASATVDLSQAESLRDVVDLINEASAANNLQIEAGYDATGTRLTLNSIDGVSQVSLTDVSGTFAADLGLTQPAASLRSVNLQRQYISETTKLSTLNNGRGVTLGKLRVTDSNGLVHSIDLTTAVDDTLGSVIREINESEAGIRARINDTGDGIVIEDTAGGSLPVRIEEDGGTAARGLNILGESGDGRIDGSWEVKVDISGSDTLEDVVQRINDRGQLVSASILNDGTGVRPYRLSLTSTAQGAAGEVIIDGGTTGLDFSTLNRAADARVLLGNDPNSGILITSASNTLTDVIPGLTINLNSVSDEPVTVNVTEDLDSTVASLGGVVTSFNALVDRIQELSKYNPETQERGILLGDRTLRTLESRVYRLFTGRVPDAPGGMQRLSEIGIKLEEGKLSFDEEKFRQVLEESPQAVVEFFTNEENGLAVWMQEELEAITEEEGLIPRRNDALGDQKELLADRIEQLDVLLARKRSRLMAQFLAMERALAELQSQQSALGQLAALAGGAGGV